MYCQHVLQVPDSITGKITIPSTGKANLILGIPFQRELDAYSNFAHKSFQGHVLKVMD